MAEGKMVAKLLLSSVQTCGSQVTRFEELPVLVTVEVERVETPTVLGHGGQHAEPLALLDQG